jgi:hypothetical protein
MTFHKVMTLQEAKSIARHLGPRSRRCLAGAEAEPAAHESGQRRTNLWREVTNPARRFGRPTCDRKRGAFLPALPGSAAHFSQRRPAARRIPPGTAKCQLAIPLRGLSAAGRLD